MHQSGDLRKIDRTMEKVMLLAVGFDFVLKFCLSEVALMVWSGLLRFVGGLWLELVVLQGKKYS